ncbi:MAG: hypothetical protein R6V13_11305 [Anaerolineae bacterium]
MSKRAPGTSSVVAFLTGATGRIICQWVHTPYHDGRKEPLISSQANGIGKLNENSLHFALKRWYARPGDRLEAPVGPFLVDIVRDDLLIEIQTGNFCSIRDKLRRLAEEHRVLLVYPIAQEKYIVKLTAARDEIISRRKSPKKGCVTDLFDELVRMPTLIQHPNFILETAIIREEEVRCDDGQGSWRRKGVSILNQELTEVLCTERFERGEDFLALLPPDLGTPFTNRELAEGTGMRIRTARRMTYCLRKMDIIEKVGTRGRAYLFDVAGEN